MDIGWLMLDLSHKSCLWMTDPILLRKLCHVLFHDDWYCLSMSCLETVLSHDVMPWDIFVSWHHFYCDSWPFMTSLVLWHYRMFQLYFNLYFFLLSLSSYIQLPLLTICPTLFLRPSIDVFLVDYNPRLYDCSPFNVID